MKNELLKSVKFLHWSRKTSQEQRWHWHCSRLEKSVFRLFFLSKSDKCIKIMELQPKFLYKLLFSIKDCIDLETSRRGFAVAVWWPSFPFQSRFSLPNYLKLFQFWVGTVQMQMSVCLFFCLSQKIFSLTLTIFNLFISD